MGVRSAVRPAEEEEEEEEEEDPGGRGKGTSRFPRGRRKGGGKGPSEARRRFPRGRGKASEREAVGSPLSEKEFSERNVITGSRQVQFVKGMDEH